MQKAPVLKGSGLKPLEETKSSEEVHVFGSNLEERVIKHAEDDKPTPVSFTSSQPDQSHSEDDIESIKKRKFDAITGEEDEETAFQGDFKLFVWDNESSNWMEKGRGQLKLNDSIDHEATKSRLIMRISGTLRIILNVAIKRSSFKIIASSKTNIRFTDSLTVWAVSGSNAQQLRNLIEERLLKSDDPTDEPTKKPKPDGITEACQREVDSEEQTSPDSGSESEQDSENENNGTRENTEKAKDENTEEEKDQEDSTQPPKDTNGATNHSSPERRTSKSDGDGLTTENHKIGAPEVSEMPQTTDRIESGEESQEER